MPDPREFQIETLEAGRSRLSYRPIESFQKSQEWITNYPQDLIRLILEIRGPASAIDEIRREEDPHYVRACLEKDILGYVDPVMLKGRRWLDFGCGGGASTMILARMFPDSPIIGLDLSDRSLEIAQARCIHYRYRNVEFRRSPSPDRLPEDIGTFDAILLSAVLEHLLPDERRTLLPGLWGLLNPGGVLFIDQTPWRCFPFEGHTTRLPMLNYLPDRMALAYARTFSRRVGSDESWQTLLRRGIRGASVREIRRILRSSVDDIELLTPNRLGLRDRVDLWYAGYAVSISNKYGWARPIQEFLRWAFKAVYWFTGAAIVPSLSLALRKESGNRETDIL
ncbi:MAG: methyltransferase domain-containing protein [Phycisphaerae bacterium]|nr:methyltransferase domain-containing protein [Phycisphaerae bacterium]